MNRKATLNKFFFSEREPLEYIDKYEENITFFNELLSKGKKEDIQYALHIKITNYASSLNKVQDFEKALKVILEIENELNKLKGISEWYQLNLEIVIYQKGLILAELKRYSESNKEFKKLLLTNPEKKNLINRYKQNLKKQISKITIIIMATLFAINIILEIFMKMGIESDNRGLRLFFSGIIILTFLIRLILQRKINKRDIIVK